MNFFIAIITILLFVFYFIQHKSKFSYSTIITFIFLGIGTQFVGHIVIIFVKLFISTEKGFEEMAKMAQYNNIFLTIIDVSLITPIIEEYIFRKLIQTKLTSLFSIKISLFLQALIFGIAHFNLYQLFPTIILGLIFGFFYYKFESLYVPITLHMFSNFAPYIWRIVPEKYDIFFWPLCAISLIIGLYMLCSIPSNKIHMISRPKIMGQNS